MKRAMGHLIFLSVLTTLVLGCDLTRKRVAKSTASFQGPGGVIAQQLDSDGDGISDIDEALLGTDPNNSDTDGDGLGDGSEVNTYRTDPKKADTDGGGINDGLEVARGTDPLDGSDDMSGDADGDGLSDEEEGNLGTDPNKADSDADGLSDGAEILVFDTDPLDPDTDNGGVNDGDEVENGSNPRNNPNDDKVVVSDSDGDGLTDVMEETLGTNPHKADTDGDGLSDGTEVNTLGTDPLDSDTDGGGVDDGCEINRGTNPLDENDDHSTRLDSDGDGLSDLQESIFGTDPMDPDSDEDGLSDGAEVNTHHTNPLKKDSDEGGIDDGTEIARGTNPLDASDDQSLLPIEISFLKTPSSETTKSGAQFVFGVDQPNRVVKVECGVDFTQSNPLSVCDPGSEITYNNLSVGKHVFLVVVTDDRGHKHLASFHWEIKGVNSNPCEGANIRTIDVDINFAKTTLTCEFGKSGNLEKKNTHVQAVRHQTLNINIPQGAVLCDADINIPRQSWHFDDHFVLTLNTLAIATNASYLLSEAESGQKIFSFDAVKGKQWGTDKAFCWAKDCALPKHDVTGNVKISLDNQEKIQLKQALQNASSLQVRLSVIGDNDSSDCKHNGLSGQVMVKYYLPTY